MLCPRCGKREPINDEMFCLVCQEMLFENSFTPEKQKETWENIGLEVEND